MQARRTEAETFRAAPSGRRILAADGCASSLSNPACCFCAVWAPGGPRGVAAAMFGHTGLGMLICRKECDDRKLSSQRGTHLECFNSANSSECRIQSMDGRSQINSAQTAPQQTV